MKITVFPHFSYPATVIQVKKMIKLTLYHANSKIRFVLGFSSGKNFLLNDDHHRKLDC